MFQDYKYVCTCDNNSMDVLYASLEQGYLSGWGGGLPRWVPGLSREGGVLRGQCSSIHTTNAPR